MVVDQSHNDAYTEPVDKTEYLRGVGLLNYLASYTRPDLLYHLYRVAKRVLIPRRLTGDV